MYVTFLMFYVFSQEEQPTGKKTEKKEERVVEVDSKEIHGLGQVAIVSEVLHICLMK